MAQKSNTDLVYYSRTQKKINFFQNIDKIDMKLLESVLCLVLVEAQDNGRRKELLQAAA